MFYEAHTRNGLIVTDDLRPFLDDCRMLRRDVSRGVLMRLRRGAYVETARWNECDDRQRHVLRVRAVLAVARRPLVAAGASAAALWGMPSPGPWPLHVTVLDEWLGGGRSEPGVRRTAAGFSTARTMEIEGIRATDLARTALEMARLHPFQDAVGSVDWAVSMGNPLAVSKSDLWAEHERLRPRAGKRSIERVLEFCSPLSGSFGESKARAVIRMLGFEDPELQTEFRDSQGRMMTDFYWRRTDVVGEFDGKEKYTRQEYTNGDPGEVAWREKKRQDRLRRIVSGVVRILTMHVERPFELDRLLVEAGVPRLGGIAARGGR